MTEDEVIEEEELIEDDALELTVEESPGYDTGNSLETEELEVVELSG